MYKGRNIMTQDMWRPEKDYDEMSRELTSDPLRFNYGVLKVRGVFLSMSNDENVETDCDRNEMEKTKT